MWIPIRFAFTTIMLISAARIVAAHPAPSGWTYPSYCCHNQDCMQIREDDVRPLREGWGVKATGEVIPYVTAKPSPDGSYHRCSPHFADMREPDHTICLFVPPQNN